MPGKSSKQRKWRNLLLDKRYQWTFTLPMVLIAAALFTGLGTVALMKVDSVTKIGINQIEHFGPLLPEGAETFTTKEILLRRADQIRYGILGSGICLCLGFIWLGLRESHRVAGPLYRVRAVLEKLAQGSFGAVPDIRKGDQLIELYARFRAFAEALRAREIVQVELWRRVVAAAEQSPDLKASVELEQLRTRLRQKEASLG